MTTVLTDLQKAKTRLLLHHPFFGTLLLNSPLKADPSVPTAYTDMRMIGYNPAFFDTLTVEEIEFVLAHEVMHIALEHGLRLRGRNPRIWNMACDYAINWILKEAGFTMADLSKFLGKGSAILLDGKHAGKSAEQIYDELIEQAQKNRRGRGQGEPGSPNDGLGDNPMDGDIRQPEAMDPATQAEVERSIQQRVAQAANMARAAGKLGGALERLVNDILNPTVPWQDLLRDYMTRVTKDDESWVRRNRRFQKMYLPSRHSERMGEIVFIGDTSGSITNEELNKVAAEVNAVAEQIQPERIRVLWADTSVKREQVFELGDTITFDAKGGGGTDMRVPLTQCEQYDEAQVVVLCTDGHTPWPEAEPPFPLIVVCTTNAPVPIGLVVRI